MTDYIYCHWCEEITEPETVTKYDSDEFWGAPCKRPYTETVCQACGKDDFEDTMTDYEAWANARYGHKYTLLVALNDDCFDADRVLIDSRGRIFGQWYTADEIGYISDQPR